jgi:hypothetical protein
MQLFVTVPPPFPLCARVCVCVCVHVCICLFVYMCMREIAEQEKCLKVLVLIINSPVKSLVNLIPVGSYILYIISDYSGCRILLQIWIPFSK